MQAGQKLQTEEELSSFMAAGDWTRLSEIEESMIMANREQEFALTFARAALTSRLPDLALKKLATLSTEAMHRLDAITMEIAAHLQRDDIASAERALLEMPERERDTSAFHRISAAILMQAGQFETEFRVRAIVANRRDANANDWAKLGISLTRFSNHTAAAQAFTRSHALHASHATAALAATSFLALGKPETAEEWYGRANTENGEPHHLIQHLETLNMLGEHERAVSLLSAAKFGTDYAHTFARLAYESNHALGRNIEAEAARQLMYETASSAPLDALEGAGHPRLFADTSPGEHSTFYRATSQKASGEVSSSDPPIRGPNARLRVGYLSADFKDHVMGKMVSTILGDSSTRIHSAILFSLTQKEDRLTQALLIQADEFVRCTNHDDSTLVAELRAAKLDILIDLSGPTAGSRPQVLACKPAPVTITHVGAAGPIGLSTIDYKLTDSICDIPENQEYLIEKLLPMDGCCYPVPKYPMPTQGLTKADLQLEGKVVIGAFYTYMKLSERCVKLWKRVLDEIPTGVLLFSPLDPKLQVAYENIMRAAEIPPTKFRFLTAGATEAERLARYRVVDFVLDSMPYGGVNGTLEALYMGVPVVTLTGKHHSERTSTSMLTHLGVTDTIAASPDEYIAHAKRLATDNAWRSDVSTRIRARWPKFADPVDYARRWEALLRKVAK
jgi:predicted O-linked N-acetylglucosamine transferase (SPINDLY family)